MLTRRTTTLTCLAMLTLMLGGCVDFGLLALDPFGAPPEPTYLERSAHADARIVVRHRKPDPWVLLANRQDHAALACFEAQIEANPRSGRPLLGYALASGFLGEPMETERAIRRALLVDPASLAGFEIDPPLDRRVDRLADRWTKCLAPRPWVNGLLVVGTLRLMTGEADDAHEAVLAIDTIDGHGAAAISLHRLVDEAVLESTSGTVYARSGAPAVVPLPVIEAPASEAAPLAEPLVAPLPGAAATSEPEIIPIAEPPVTPPERAADVVPLPPAAPVEPVDYDALRTDLLTMSETLDRFSAKLIERMRAKTPKR